MAIYKITEKRTSLSFGQEEFVNTYYVSSNLDLGKVKFNPYSHSKIEEVCEVAQLYILTDFVCKRQYELDTCEKGLSSAVLYKGVNEFDSSDWYDHNCYNAYVVRCTEDEKIEEPFRYIDYNYEIIKIDGFEAESLDNSVVTEFGLNDLVVDSLSDKAKEFLANQRAWYKRA